MKAVRFAYLAVFALFSIGPILVIFSVSITNSRLLTFPPQGLSLRWFREIFVDEAWFSALVNSVTIALSASLLSTLIALPIAYVTWRGGVRYAKALAAFGIVPFILPPVITSLGLLLLFTSIGVHGALMNGVLAHAVYLLALPLVIVSLGFETIERPLLEAGATLGANDWQAFRTIVFPMALPYAVTAFAFCVVLSLNEYIIMLMTVGFTHETVPIRIFNALRYGYSPVLASIAVVFMTVNVLIFGLVAIFSDLPKLLGSEVR